MMELNTIQKRMKSNEVVVVNLNERDDNGGNYLYNIVTNTHGTQEEPQILQTIEFEHGSEKGVLDSDLLEIVRHRLKSFQCAFPNFYNEKALEYVELALMYLNRKVDDQIIREVSKKNEK